MNREQKIKAVERIINEWYCSDYQLKTNCDIATVIVDSMEIDIDKVFSLVEEVCENPEVFDYPIEITKALTIAGIIKIKE